MPSESKISPRAQCPTKAPVQQTTPRRWHGTWRSEVPLKCSTFSTEDADMLRNAFRPTSITSIQSRPQSYGGPGYSLETPARRLSRRFIIHKAGTMPRRWVIRLKASMGIWRRMAPGYRDGFRRTCHDREVVRMLSILLYAFYGNVFGGMTTHL